MARAAREVIVSGGAVNSPQLLLLSGIGPKEHLQEVNVTVAKDLPGKQSAPPVRYATFPRLIEFLEAEMHFCAFTGVGENLQNHVSYTLSFNIDQPNEFELSWAAAVEYIAFHKGPMASTGLSQLTGILPSMYTSSEHPDLQLFFGGYQAACSESGEVGALMDDGRRSISISPTNLHPRSRGTVLRLPHSSTLRWIFYVR